MARRFKLRFDGYCKRAVPNKRTIHHKPTHRYVLVEMSTNRDVRLPFQVPHSHSFIHGDSESANTAVVSDTVSVVEADSHTIDIKVEEIALGYDEFDTRFTGEPAL